VVGGIFGEPLQGELVNATKCNGHTGQVRDVVARDAVARDAAASGLETKRQAGDRHSGKRVRDEAASGRRAQ
jgi:hypothetical protein